MSKVSYDGNLLRPAPFMSISQSANSNKDGEILSSVYKISLNGYILPNVGSPDSNGVFGSGNPEDCEVVSEEDLLTNITAKYCAISDLFSTNHLELVIGSLTGSGDDITCFPKIIDKNLEDGKHAEFSKYQINMEADNIFCGGVAMAPASGCVDSYSENWQLDTDERITEQSGQNRVFSLTHTVNAVGRPRTNSSGVEATALECAREFVCPRLGFSENQISSSCISGIPEFTKGYNHILSETVNENDGSYSVIERWILASGLGIEDFSVERQTARDNGLETVTVQGTITGLECRENGVVASGDDKYSNAVAKFAEVQPLIYTRAKVFSGRDDLNSDPVSYTVGRSILNGVITYNYTYNNRFTKRIASARYENISVSNNWEEDIVVNTRIWGRGEALQRTNDGSTGFRAHKTNLNIDVVYECSGDDTPLLSPRSDTNRAPDIQAIVDTYNPQNILGVPAYIDSQNETWVPETQSYNYSVSWLWQPSGVC